MVDTSFPLAERLLGFNRHHNSLTNLRELVTAGTDDYKLVDGLLLYRECLVVPDVDNLRTDLVREAHE